VAGLEPDDFRPPNLDEERLVLENTFERDPVAVAPYIRDLDPHPLLVVEAELGQVADGE
jgi:hypothetical protein